MIAYCGLNCSKCDAYLATIENNDAKKKETAQKWSKMYQFEMSPDQINCDGCKSSGHFALFGNNFSNLIPWHFFL